MRRHKGSSKRHTAGDDDSLDYTGGAEEQGIPLGDPSLRVSPIALFTVTAECHRWRSGYGPLEPTHLLPTLSTLCSEEGIATVMLGWDTRGIFVTISADKAFERAILPEIQKGDSVELFIDTRDSKSSGFNNRFCHHFFFLPEAVDGHQAGEITRFRTEDVHEWCDAKDLKVTCHKWKDSYRLDIFIPAHCLHGYDPEQFDRIGFTYRINQPGGDPQHFSVCSRDFPIEQQPSLWASVRLVE